MEPNKFPWKYPVKAGFLLMNRFTIEESAGFELLEVLKLRKVTERLTEPRMDSEDFKYHHRKFKYNQYRKERYNKGREIKDFGITPSL